MLLGQALECWSAGDADEYKRDVTYAGVFVPTDRTWARQLDSLTGEGFTEEHAALFAVAAFTTQVLWALVDVMDRRARPPDPGLAPHLRVRLGRKDEAEIVAAIAPAWSLMPALGSLQSLRHSLTARANEMHTLASRERVLGSAGRPERLAAEPGLHLNYQDASALAVDVYNDASNERERKWALLFDELELTPEAIREQLLASPRSTDDRFIFKLSLSPYSPYGKTMGDALGSMAGHDYVPISLSYGRKGEGYSFCERLLRSMLLRRGLPPASSEWLLGRSAFDTSPDEWATSGTAYSPGSRLSRRFASLYRKDSTFRAYCQRHELLPHALAQLTVNERAALVRKISPLVAVRDEFLKGDRIPAHAGGRSRKVPTVYAGNRSFFAMVENNPRYFIAALSALLDDASLKQRAWQWNDRGTKRTPVNLPSPLLRRQTRELDRVSNRFRALLRTVPLTNYKRAVNRDVLSLLDDVGHALADLAVFGPFDPEPPGSFHIDGEVSDAILMSLGLALNAGAIVHLPEGAEGDALKSLVGERFRLSYLLAPSYHLPVRLGRAVSLTQLLRHAKHSSALRLKV